MNKLELRKLFLEKRAALIASEYADLSEQLCKTFFLSVNLSSVRVLHTFLPIEKNREPNTWLILDRVHHDFENIKLSIPKVNSTTGDLDHFYWEGRDQVGLHSWGIPEPRHGKPTPVRDIDMVLVPLLAFDKQGHRVGYGKGYYDRFLATCRKSCKKIGLSFFPPVELISTKEEHDQKLDMVITPDEFYQF